MGGGVAAQLALVAGGGERLAVAGDDGADRHVAVALGARAPARSPGPSAARASGVKTPACIHRGVCATYNFAGGPVLGKCSLECRGFQRASTQMNRRLPILAAAALLAALVAGAGAGRRGDRDRAGARTSRRGQVIVKFDGRAARAGGDAAAAGRRARGRGGAAQEPAASPTRRPNYIATASAASAGRPPSSPTTPARSRGPGRRRAAGSCKQWNFLPWEGRDTAPLPISPGGIDAVGAWENLIAAGRPGAEGRHRRRPRHRHRLPRRRQRQLPAQPGLLAPASSSRATTSSTTTACRSTRTATAPTSPGRSPRRPTTAIGADRARLRRQADAGPRPRHDTARAGRQTSPRESASPSPTAPT